ncbi:MAG: hypothetical protein V3T08_07760 [Gemmatimonadota bacterium]
MSEHSLRIRVIMPDLWREQQMEFAPNTPVGKIKKKALPELLRTSDADPSDYYVEYFEKEILDESQTLAALGVPKGGVISIRPYDADHPAPFRG